MIFNQVCSQGDERTAEIDLLLFCARTHADAQTVARIETLQQQPIDWSYLIQVASHQRVIPLLYQTLKQHVPSAVPPSIFNQLRKQFQINALYNSLLTQELLRLLNQFAAHEIPAIPFKGPILATALYGNLALRQFVDLDILIRKQDISRARDLLILEGYQPSTNYGWQQEFLHVQAGFTVDLHWELTPSYFPFSLGDFEQLWQRTRSISLQEQSVPTFSADDLLVILMLQIARSGFEGKELLVQVCDLAELLRIHPILDAQKLMQQARALNIERPLWISLLLVEDLLQVQLPDDLRQIMQHRRQSDPVINIYVTRMGNRLLSISEHESSLVIQEFVQYLMTAKPFTGMTRSIYLTWQFLCFAISRIFVFTQVDRDFLSLPSLLFPLYYFIRPVRLIGKFGIRKIRQLSQNKPLA